jgi:hypothetical protein
MPSGATGQFALFQHQHIGDAQFGQVVRSGATRNATTNDDDL